MRIAAVLSLAVPVAAGCGGSHGPGRVTLAVHAPLEYFARAAGILRRQPHVARVATMGDSRGGETSLLVAAHFPRLIHGAIGLVPSHQVNASSHRFDRPAWTYRGRPPAGGTPIAVERMAGPILTVGAGADAVWDSSVYVHQIELRLRDRRLRFVHAALTYPRAGHYPGTAMPCVPGPTDQEDLGGTAAGDAAAKADLWPRILRFLARLNPARG